METATLSTVRRLAAGWRALPPVHVVAEASAFPFAAPADAAGALFRGEVFLVDGQPVAQAARVLAHEVIGHHALRVTLGASHASFMQALHAGARAGDARLQVLREHIESTYVDEAGYPSLRPVQLADEVAAHAAEWVFDPETGRLAVPGPLALRARAARGHLAREVLFMDHPACCDQLLGVLLEAEHQLRHGGAFWGLCRRWYSAAVKPTGPKVPACNLAESEDMLAAERHRLKAKDEWRAMGQLALAGLGVIALGGVALYWIGVLFGVFRL